MEAPPIQRTITHLVDQVYPFALGRGNWLYYPCATLPKVGIAEVTVLGGKDEAGWNEVKQLHPKLSLHPLDVHVQPILTSELR